MSNYLDNKMDEPKSNPNLKKWWDCIIKTTCLVPKEKGNIVHGSR